MDAAAAAVVHEGYLTCIVVSSLVGRPFIKANRRCVCSSSILFEFTYLTYLHFFHFCFYLYSHFLTDFGGLFFYFSFFSAIPTIVLFSPSPLMMIITYYLPVDIRLFFLFFFLFFFSFLFSFPFSLPCGGPKRCGPSRSSSKSRQADSNSKSLLARSIACSVGSFLFPSNSMEAERERGSSQIFVLVMHTYQDRGAIDRSIDILPLLLHHHHAPGL